MPHGAESFAEAATANVQVHERISDALKKKDKLFSGGKSDEGAWVANVLNQDAFEILVKTCEEVGNELGFECGAGIDVASSSLWNPKDKAYVYEREGKKLDTGEQTEFILDAIKKYRLVYVEDPLREEDFEGFSEITKKVKNCLICGDDLFATNHERLSRGVRIGAANAAIIKVNQVGTLTDASETIEVARRSGYVPVMSHRSGDTCDWHIAHLAVAFKCPLIKAGIVEGTRIAKINELIRIEEFLGERARMASVQTVQGG